MAYYSVRISDIISGILAAEMQDVFLQLMNKDRAVRNFSRYEYKRALSGMDRLPAHIEADISVQLLGMLGIASDKCDDLHIVMYMLCRSGRIYGMEPDRAERRFPEPGDLEQQRAGL